MQKKQLNQMIIPKKKLLTISKLRDWFYTVVLLHTSLPLPKPMLLAQLLEIIYESNGIPEDIIQTILKRGIIKSTKMAKQYIEFLTRIAFVENNGDQIKVKKNFHPPIKIVKK